MKILFIGCLLTMAVLHSCKQKQQADDAAVTKDTAARVPGVSPASQDTVVPENGFYEKKHQNGRTAIRGEMRNGQRVGIWLSYYEDGTIWSQGEYRKGVRHGIAVTYYENGQKRYEGRYKNGQQAGVWKYYTQDGRLEKEIDHGDPTAR